MPYLKVSDERIFYAYHPCDQGRAPALVLIHGAGGSHLMWGHAIRSLQGASVYALDLPGHGRSDGRGRWSIGDYADFIARFLDAATLERVVIAGHSMGGAIALQYGLRDPTRLQGLALVGTGARLRVNPAILEGLRQNFAAAVDLIIQYSFAPGADPSLIAAARKQMLATPPAVLYDDFAACDAFDLMEKLGQINCPTQVICGSGDRLTPLKYSEYLRDHIAGAQLSVIESAGHMVMLERPKAVADAIAALLTRL